MYTVLILFGFLALLQHWVEHYECLADDPLLLPIFPFIAQQLNCPISHRSAYSCPQLLYLSLVHKNCLTEVIQMCAATEDPTLTPLIVTAESIYDSVGK